VFGIALKREGFRPYFSGGMSVPKKGYSYGMEVGREHKLSQQWKKLEIVYITDMGSLHIDSRFVIHHSSSPDGTCRKLTHTHSYSQSKTIPNLLYL